MKYCEKCKKTYSDAFTFCPICAEKLIDKEVVDKKRLDEIEREKELAEVHKIEKEYQALRKQVISVYDYFEYERIFPSKLRHYSFVGNSTNKANQALEMLKDYADAIMFHKIHTPKKMFDELMVMYDKLVSNSKKIKTLLAKAKAKEPNLGLYFKKYIWDVARDDMNIDAYINGGTYTHVYRESGVSKKFSVAKSLKSRITDDILKGKENILGPNYLYLKNEFESLFAHQSKMYFGLEDFLNGAKQVGILNIELDNHIFEYFSKNYLRKI